MATFRPDLKLVANPLLDSQCAFSTSMWHPKPSWKSNRWERYFNAARSLSSLNGWDVDERISDSLNAPSLRSESSRAVWVTGGPHPGGA